MNNIFKYIIKNYINDDENVFRNSKMVIIIGFDVKYNNQIFIFACVDPNFPFIRYLVENGADKNMALHLVLKNYHKRENEMVKYLLKKGVNTEHLENEGRWTQLLEKTRIEAANKIANWWIPICYRLLDENGERRMAVKAWKKLEM